jgi:hypothetical protein
MFFVGIAKQPIVLIANEVSPLPNKPGLANLGASLRLAALPSGRFQVDSITANTTAWSSIMPPRRTQAILLREGYRALAERCD